MISHRSSVISTMRPAVISLLLAVLAPAARADLTFPASFEVLEDAPSQFKLSLTVPLIKGKYMKAKPVVPDAFRGEGEVKAQAGAGSLTRTWRAQVDPASLPGMIFGLDGLLGTAGEVRFVMRRSSGRQRHSLLFLGILRWVRWLRRRVGTACGRPRGMWGCGRPWPACFFPVLRRPNASCRRGLLLSVSQGIAG